MFEELVNPATLASLAALTGLEIVLGIDNIVFIAIMVARLPDDKQKAAYRIGLGAALITRLGLLLTLSWLMGMNAELFRFLGQSLSGRDLILILGGGFLVYKASHEIFEKVERVGAGGAGEVEDQAVRAKANMKGIVLQIMLIDIVFSLDSVITAVGIADQIWVMSTAMIIAVLVMMLFAKSVGEFVNRNPSMQILALSFLMLIGVLLVAEGFGQHVSKGYVYSSMAFALVVEMMQLRRRRRVMRNALDKRPKAA
ncbi:MAG: TerC family protein [Myxococcales bacterium]|nr:TerC family protein [Myxococcales bacterium]